MRNKITTAVAALAVVAGLIVSLPAQAAECLTLLTLQVLQHSLT